jgi:hypothetical protein
LRYIDTFIFIISKSLKARDEIFQMCWDSTRDILRTLHHQENGYDKRRTHEKDTRGFGGVRGAAGIRSCRMRNGDRRGASDG